MNEDFGGDIITIADEEGNEFELEILDELEVDGQSYTVFVPANIDTMNVDDPDYGLIFLRTREENGEIFYDSIDSDEELDKMGTGALRLAVQEGDMERGCFLSGQIAAMVNKVQPAAEIVREVCEEAEPILRSAVKWVK